MGFPVSVHHIWVILLMFAASTIALKAEAAEECKMKRCSHHGPEIRFPFQLEDRQPQHCGLPGFRLFCQKGKTLIHLQHAVNTSIQGIQLLYSIPVFVLSINYTYQDIELYFFDPKINDLKLVPTSTSMHSSITIPPVSYFSGLTFVSCPSTIKNKPPYVTERLITFPGGQASHIYLSHYTTDGPSIASCVKIFNSSFPDYFITNKGLVTIMHWSTPNCSMCEAKREYCMMKNNTSNHIQTDDDDIPLICVPRGGHHTSITPIACIIPGATLAVVVLTVLFYYTIRAYRRKKYDALKIEMFLADYKAMKPTRYSYADIKKITSHFSDKLGQGGYGSVYKGQITKDITVAVKVLNSDPNADGEDFINEVGTIGRIYHINVVRLVGYCADGCDRALVYEFQPNHSLETFTYSAKNQQKNFLGWEKMQEITLGIAKGIEYLHQGCAQQILHFDIKPQNILLDQNFNPKISDFGLAKLCSKDQSMVSMTMARGTIGYIAPEVFSRNFGKVSSKSDVYSFGMLLLEMVGARDNNAAENTSETYFPEWIFHRLEEGGEVAIEIEKEEDSNIARKLTVVGLWCIGWHPVDRPSMKHVIHMLESQECPALPPNPFRSSNVRIFINDLEAISESE